MKVTKYFCDLCGEQISSKPIADIDFVILSEPEKRIKTNEICPDCVRKIHNFLSNINDNRKTTERLH